MRRVSIESWEQLQEQVESILERLNADPALALAAAANPLYALEELGFQISPHVRPEIEDRLRFRPRAIARLRELRGDIYRHAGRPFDLDSGEELERVLFDRLGLVPPVAAAPAPQARRAEPKYRELAEETAYRPPPRLDLRPLVREPGRKEESRDPLESLRGAHPIVEPLLEYRRLEASEPRLAPRALYDDVRRGKRRLGVVRVRGRLKGQPS